MNAVEILSAAQKIQHLQEALIWMRENGRSAIDPHSRDAFGVHISLNSCSALRGAKEASVQLSAQAKLLGQEILENAIKDAENTIEILRQKIAREAGEKSPT